MGLPSKEEAVLSLFFNEPSKQWHFEEIVRVSKLSRGKVNKWLTKCVKERIIRHISPRGEMPYFQGWFESPAYRNRKRLYASSKLYESGFLNHLASLPKAKTIIIFGSFTRADWYSGSDIDVFIYGSDDGLNEISYRSVLHRNIQVFVATSTDDLKQMGPGLLRNIIEGIIVKGKLDFIRVSPLAAV